eukprot:CAMPEP_0171623422 /NCGR_PEP_ID=MMETSP0990-20121206/17937_1 /TAXON_ID=483369 /ORGANISM="non described non described, Strain CCMP2098" /LENGTH=73 /DNA_ID=CAMNT_0012189623 /DNA_START=41 /DNA_END=262 /DNA_ORIENTATION=+
MSSGFGAFGGQGRCYPVWSKFNECMSTTSEVKECTVIRNDYIECLHHRREFEEVKKLHAKHAEAEAIAATGEK